MVGAAAEPPQNGLPTGVKRAAEAQAPTALTALIPPGPVARCAALTVLGAGGGAKDPSPLQDSEGKVYTQRIESNKAKHHIVSNIPGLPSKDEVET